MTQVNAIIDYLKPSGRTITPMQALKKFNCWALSSRASDIKKMGINIKSKFVTKNGKTYSKYYIE